jgi:phage gp45-like
MILEIVSDIVVDALGRFTAKGALERDTTGEAAWHFGFYSRPKDGADGVVVRGSPRGGFAILVGYRDRQYEISLEKGECAMANAFGAKVVLDKDGRVVMNGGSKGVARLDDTCDAGTLTLTFAAPTAITGAYVAPDGTSTSIATNVPLRLKAKINSASGTVRAG